MTNFQSIKISELPPREVLLQNDLLVVDRLQQSGEYVTNAIRVTTLADLITTLDLNFTGNVTFINTIQPPIDGELDGIFDHLTIRQSITIEDGAEINGIFLDDLEDVVISSVKEGDILRYEPDEITGELRFTNVGGIIDAPDETGRIYGWSEGDWVDITDCLRCPTNKIGTTTIVKLDDFPLSVGTTHTYIITTPTADPSLNLTHVWSVDSSTVNFSNPTSKETNVIFNSAGEFTLTCTTRGPGADDTPQIATKVANIRGAINNVFITREDSNGDYVGAEVTLTVDTARANVDDLTYQWSVTTNASFITDTDLKTIKATINREGDITFICAVRSQSASDSPQTQAFRISAVEEDTIGTVEIVKVANNLYSDTTSECDYPGDNPKAKIHKGAGIVGSTLTAILDDCLGDKIYQWQKLYPNDEWRDELYATNHEHIPYSSGCYRCMIGCQDGAQSYSVSYTPSAYITQQANYNVERELVGETITLVAQTLNSTLAERDQSYSWSATSGATITSANNIKTITATLDNTDEVTFTVSVSGDAGDSPQLDTYQIQAIAPVETYRLKAENTNLLKTNPNNRYLVYQTPNRCDYPGDSNVVTINCGSSRVGSPISVTTTCEFTTLYQWQIFNKNNDSWMNMTGIVTNSTYTPTQDGCYRCVVSCQVEGQSRWDLHRSAACQVGDGGFVGNPYATLRIIFPEESVVGTTLTAVFSDCNDVETYQWQQLIAPQTYQDIDGATNKTYTPTTAGVYRVKGTCGDFAKTSLNTINISAPTGDPYLTLTGNPEIGSTLSASWTNCTATRTYQWIRREGAGEFENIPNANNSTLTITRAGRYACEGYCGGTFDRSEIVNVEDPNAGSYNVVNPDMFRSVPDQVKWPDGADPNDYIITLDELKDDVAEAANRWNSFVKLKDTNHELMRLARPGWNGIECHTLEITDRTIDGRNNGWVMAATGYELLRSPDWCCYAFKLFIDAYHYRKTTKQIWDNSYLTSKQTYREYMKGVLLHEIGHSMGMTQATNPYYRITVNPDLVTVITRGNEFLTDESNTPNALAGWGSFVPMYESGSTSYAAHTSSYARTYSGGGKYSGGLNTVMSVPSNAEPRRITPFCTGFLKDLGYEEITPGSKEADIVYSTRTREEARASWEEILRAADPTLPAGWSFCGTPILEAEKLRSITENNQGNNQGGY